jgi:hypothetical protein
MDFNKKLARILPLLSEAKVGDELHTTIRGWNSPLSVGYLVAKATLTTKLPLL